jgi:hypothetical protein
MGNTRVRPAIYNAATGTYTTPPALNTTALKSKHLANIPAAASAIATPPADIDMLDEDPEADVTAQPKPTLDEDRTFSVRKWVLVPAAEADKRPEPKYLADPRPGLKNLRGYGQTANVDPTTAKASTNGAALGAVTNAAGKEISSTGLELSTLGKIGMETSASAPIADPPRRRGPPPPPKRKKKGGLGRRKKVLVDPAFGDQPGQNITGADGTADESGTGSGVDRIKAEDAETGDKGGGEEEEDDDEDEEDGSETDEGDEGSEDGEIDEGDIMMTADVAEEGKEPDNHAAQLATGIAGARRERLHLVEASEPVTLPMSEASPAEPDLPSAMPKVEDVEESMPPVPPKAASVVEAATLPTPAPAVEETTMLPETNTPTAPIKKPKVEEADEVDLLGSLDRAVEGMQGANVDARDTAEEKPTG